MSFSSARTTSVPATFILYYIESLLQSISILSLQAPAHVRHVSAYRRTQGYIVSRPQRPPCRKPLLHPSKVCTKLNSHIKSDFNFLVKHTVSKRNLPTFRVIDLRFDKRLKMQQRSHKHNLTANVSTCLKSDPSLYKGTTQDKFHQQVLKSSQKAIPGPTQECRPK